MMILWYFMAYPKANAAPQCMRSISQTTAIHGCVCAIYIRYSVAIKGPKQQNSFFFPQKLPNRIYSIIWNTKFNHAKVMSAWLTVFLLSIWFVHHFSVMLTISCGACPHSWDFINLLTEWVKMWKWTWNGIREDEEEQTKIDFSQYAHGNEMKTGCYGFGWWFVYIFGAIARKLVGKRMEFKC